uniref:Uncharacterized protein n=1 Tax=Medicago truncatula TaxID=3880 RepID=A2Q273_MEDTR|nr:hypothetical protein MtrDRAFT_AC149489g20v2 [Medicago truncatula]
MSLSPNRQTPPPILLQPFYVEHFDFGKMGYGRRLKAIKVKVKP